MRIRHLRTIGSHALLVALLLLALAARLYGLDWDRGLLFHPDERQILMVVSRLALPGDWLSLLSPRSPLNPAFFAYGSLPIYLLRALSWLVGLWRAEWATLTRFYLLGRLLSACLDTVAVYLTYVLTRRVFSDRRAGLLAAAFVSMTVLHIQLAHFYTVDTLLVVWVLGAMAKAVDVAENGRWRDGAQLGALLGAALATKLSALPLVAVAGGAWMLWAWPVEAHGVSRKARLRAAWSKARRPLVRTLALALVTFLLCEPYALIDAAHFVQGVGQEIAMSQGWFDFPYTRQYAGTPRYLYPLRQLLWFGMGPLLSVAGLAGLLYIVWRTWHQPRRAWIVWLAWPLLYGLMQGGAYAKFLRYMLPLTPFLCAAAAVLLCRAWDAARRSRFRSVACSGVAALLVCILASTLFCALAFEGIYTQPHPWFQATAYLCEHLPDGATVLTEVWDDPLPLQGSTPGACPREFVRIAADLQAPDSDAKLEQLLDDLQASDAIVLSTDRLYAPITRLAARFPLSSRYYRLLFGEQLGYQLVAAPALYPAWGGVTLADDPRAGLDLPIPPLLAAQHPPGTVIHLGRADESFTVYDHPQPLIFWRVERLPRAKLRELLMGGPAN